MLTYSDYLKILNEIEVMQLPAQKPIRMSQLTFDNVFPADTKIKTATNGVYPLQALQGIRVIIDDTIPYLQCKQDE